MNFLNLLLQSIAPGASGNNQNYDDELTPEQIAEMERDGINVMGSKRVIEEAPPPPPSYRQPDPRPQSRNPSYTDPAERPEVTPRYVTTDDRMPPTEEEMRELLPRKRGYWGTTGKARDILGTISDAFLVQGGEKPMYRNLRDQERIADALYGATDDPMAAVERLAMMGYGKEAADFLKETQTNQYNTANLQSQNAGRQSLANDRAFDNKDKGFNRIARWTAGGVPYPKLVTAAANYGITEEELNGLGITPDMTDEQRSQIGAMDMTVNQQFMLPIQQQRADATTSQALSSRIRANRAPAGRAPPRPESASEFEARIRGKIANGTATQAEINSLSVGKRTSGNGRRPVTPEPSPRFRILNPK